MSVTITINHALKKYGQNTIIPDLNLEIKPEAVDPDDVEMLQDMILAATNEALREAGETVEREMGKLTGGMGIPGLF